MGADRPFRVKSVVLGALADVLFTPKAGIRTDEIDVRYVPLATKVRCSKNPVYLDGTRGKITLNSANSPGTVSTSIEPPCCLTMMS